MTPERYRSLADELQSAAAIDFGVCGDTMFTAQAALRTAADQLEAVRAIVEQLSNATPRRLLEEALDTAPQEDRDE